ncbi:MAG: hypothetical protein M3R44_04840 [Candidatus Eremiobacteraeota bacterium]|nr:hypothetical protein [Candidatus Eremiobacteraeota bacterium]
MTSSDLCGIGSLVRRPWTRAERKIVLTGLLRRLLLAIEPLICFAVFGALTVALIFLPLPHGSPPPPAGGPTYELRSLADHQAEYVPPRVQPMTRRESAIIIAPIFGLAALAFLIYTVALLVAPLRALLQTFSPIFIVDGYVRYRKPDRKTELDSNGYVAVLNEERRTVAEWPSLGAIPLPDSFRPALIEFSYYGGIHRIDGRSTGALPESLSFAGVGIAPGHS